MKTKKSTIKKIFWKYSCPGALFYTLTAELDTERAQEALGSSILGGGMMQTGNQCGMIWGATLAAGAQAHRVFGPGAQAEAKAIIAAQRLVESFRARNKHMNCLEITEIDKSSSTMQMITYFLIKGGTIGCFQFEASFAILKGCSGNPRCSINSRVLKNGSWRSRSC